jgi:hypothetical protein
MNEPIPALQQRRAELLAKIAAQRGQLSEITTRLQTPLEIADRGIAVIRYFRARPFWAAAIVAVFVARRHGVAALLSGGWRLWTGYRRLGAIFAKPSSRG